MKLAWLGVVALQCVLVQSVYAEAENPDPWESVNRITHGFNDGIDRAVLKPVAKGYKNVVPGGVRRIIGRFFSNLDEFGNVANNLLQGKAKYAVGSAGRLLINTTVGLGGLLDPATDMGLLAHPEDFSQTFRVWGVPNGPYLVIPLLGPSTVTDAASLPLDGLLGPLRDYHPVRHRNTLRGVALIDGRASVLGAESVLFGDRYIFFRDAYLQRQNYLAKDGQVVDEFDDF
ncbi:VacJ family lipoprotein [Pseudomonadales bacterium]|nr:VacJ family lipoprotein [Pseudomonadales bacterium]MDB9879248.1 VacJ family lipoprotein [Pseudomonadales bacterium]